MRFEVAEKQRSTQNRKWNDEIVDDDGDDEEDTDQIAPTSNN